MASVHDELSRSITQLLLAEPFFAHLLAGVVRRVVPSIPTAGVGIVDDVMSLLVNPRFFLETLGTDSERTAVIKHEALHLLLFHVTRRQPEHDPLLHNFAADLVVNQLIGTRWHLPRSAITLATFPDLGLEPDRTLDWYYERLFALAGDANGAPKSGATLARMRQNAVWHSDHGSWMEASPATEVQEHTIDRLIEQAWSRSKDHGELPATLVALIEAAIDRRRPRVDWRRALRIFAASSRRTRVVTTLRRKSKRFGTHPGIRVKRHQRLAVAIDTSGSLARADLERFFAEIHAIWRQGADVTVYECDAAVQRVWPYQGRLTAEIHGCGGTRFDPVFERLRSERRRYDACIYLTDGCADRPRVRPPCPLLWVVTPSGHTGAHLPWGRVIQLVDNGVRHA